MTTTDRFSVFCGTRLSNLIVWILFRGEKTLSSYLSRGAFLRKEGARVRIAGYFRGTNADDDETVRKRLR